MAVDIRPAEPADATTIALLGRITFAETFGHLFSQHQDDLRRYLDTTFDVTKTERSLAKPQNRYWLALCHRLPVGYAKLKHPSPPPGQPLQNAAQLQKIYVLRSFVGQHIGQALMQPVIQAAVRQAPLLWLDVLRENESAIAFYNRHGFVGIGEDTYTIGAQQFRFSLMASQAT